jgi:ATP-dependent helicase/nuclease subunit B
MPCGQDRTVTGPYAELLELVGQSRIVTVNDRLARRLLADYDLRQLQAGRLAWKKPPILACEQWLAELSEICLPEHLFPSPVQDQLLWEQVIRAQVARAEHALVQIPATAKRAQEAHRLLRQYLAEPSLAPTAPDHQVFLLWQQAYLQQLAAAGFNDRSLLPRQLAAALQTGCAPQQPVLLVGFDELKPDLALLIDTLQATGGTVTLWPSLREARSRKQLCLCADAEAEVRAAARWARRQVAAGAQRIGIVVPELQRYRPLFSSVFAAELAPQAVISGTLEPLPFNLSLGGALADEGVVAAALATLAPGPEWSLDELSRWLRSPYLSREPAGAGFRVNYELRVRKTRQLRWNRAQLLKLFKGSEKGATGKRLYQALEALGQWARLRTPLPPDDWGARILELLHQVGWPGSRGLNSREYQALDKFRALLQGFAVLDPVLGRISRLEAVALLQRLCQDETFQPEAPDCKIEVVGLLESGGLRFDCLWVMGLHDGLLPDPLRPNPFLPYPLQQQYRMPHADLAHETAYCHGLAARLFHAAPTVVASYPQQDGDTPLRGNHLLRDWQESYAPEPESLDPALVMAGCRPPLESLTDDQAPTLHSRKVVTGGTALLKDQALCPFRAFAHHRLRATAPETADVGLDAMMRGSLAHHLLEQFWRDCGDSTTLLALSGAALAGRLESAAEAALAVFERAEKRDLPPRLRRLEADRLQQLGREWLQLELQRGPFEVLVERLEQPQLVSFGALQIRTRIDRIDRLASGQLAVLDYKTGQPDPLQWLDARMTEPQLPVYASQYQAEQLGAVLFAQVRSGACRFRGLVEGEGAFPGLPEKRLTQRLAETGCDSLAAVTRHWEATLQALAAQFTSGWAAVDPIDENQACRFCDLTSLCRIRESVAVPEGGSDD